MTELFIDQEFRSLIPPLAPEELAMLEQSILEEGVRDAIITWNGYIVDGHNRYDIITRNNITDYRVITKQFADKEAAKIWIMRNQIGRRNVSSFLRAEYIFKVNEWDNAQKNKSKGGRGNLVPIDTKFDAKKLLAEKLNIGSNTASRIIQIHEKAPEEIKQQLRKGDISINDAYVKIRRQEKEAEHQEQIKVIQSITGQLPDSCKLICGDLKVECMKLEPQSIDYIITDPPYGKEYLQLYADLSEVSKYVLKPMGSLFVMTGQSYLPEIISLLTKSMTYHWTICYLTPGDSTMLWQRNVRTNWKPIVWLTPNGNKPEWHTDIVESPKKDKQFMNWGQSEEGMADIIGKYTKKNELILDPFLGAGTTGIVALRMERRFIGIELSPETFKTAQGRILNDKTGIH